MGRRNLKFWPFSLQHIFGVISQLYQGAYPKQVITTEGMKAFFKL